MCVVLQHVILIAIIIETMKAGVACEENDIGAQVIKLSTGS